MWHGSVAQWAVPLYITMKFLRRIPSEIAIKYIEYHTNYEVHNGVKRTYVNGYLITSSSSFYRYITRTKENGTFVTRMSFEDFIYTVGLDWTNFELFSDEAKELA